MGVDRKCKVQQKEMPFAKLTDVVKLSRCLQLCWQGFFCTPNYRLAIFAVDSITGKRANLHRSLLTSAHGI